MIISHKNKFVFIAINKTATTSIRTSLHDKSDVNAVADTQSPYYFHATAKRLKIEFKKNSWDWNSYFKFSFVRNPWDRIVSAYFYRLKMVKHWNKIKPKDKYTHDVFECFKVQLHSVSNFNQWLKKYANHESVNLHQHKFLYDGDEKLVNFVGKYENLSDDFNYVMSKVGCEHIKLPFLNKSNRTDYKNYFDDETRKLIKKYYSKDINLFNYKYND